MAEFTQGRVRVSEEGAQELYLALEAHHGWLIDKRLASPYLTTEYNRRLKAIRRVMTEVESVFESKNWRYPDEEYAVGELFEPDEAGAGAPEAAGRGGPVGRRP